MAIFYILGIYLIIVHFTIPESEKQTKSIFAALGFVLVLALRSPFCGLDVTGTSDMIMPSSYGGVFLNMRNYSYGDIFSNTEYVGGHLEIGWLLLAKTISLFTNNLQLYLAVIAIIQFIPIAYVIGKYSSNIVLSYFVFACLGSYVHYFSGIRQMLAVSIIMLAFDLIYQGRIRMFIFTVIAASFIHTSALLFIIIWPLSKIRLYYPTTLACIALMVAFMPFYHFFIADIIELFFASKYDSYFESEGVATTMFIVYTLFLLLSFLYKGDNRKIRLLRMILLIGIGGQSLGVLGDNAITRIGYYYNVFLMLMLPDILLSFKHKKERDVITIIGYVLLCLFFTLTTKNNSGVVPYDFFWDRPVVYI